MTGRLHGELKMLRRLFGDLLLSIENTNIPDDKERYIKSKIQKTVISVARVSAIGQKLVVSTKQLQRDYDELKRGK